MPQDLDVVCLGGGVAGEAIVLAIKQRILLKALADGIHPLPAFNRVLGPSLDELAAKAGQRRTILMSFATTNGGHNEQHPDSE